MSKPVAGQWYEYLGTRQHCIAVNDISCVMQSNCGDFEIVYAEDYDDLKHLPDCTGWDWVEETFPQYYDHGLKGDRRNGTAFIRRDSVEKYACVSVDGCDKTKYDWNESCKYYVRCGTWKQITEQQALALLDKPQPAEDPEEWVVQDRVPARVGVDEFRWSCWQGYYFHVVQDHNIACGMKHGQVYEGSTLSVRCRREDLPAPKRTVTVPKWLCRLGDDWRVIQMQEDPFEYDEVHRVGETTYEID